MKALQVMEAFKKLYGEGGEVRLFHSPGRVNLIGEHIDYNGGYVFPCALDFGTFGAVRVREDSIVNLASTNFELRVSVNLEDLSFKSEDDWANYPKGVLKLMKEEGHTIKGMDILISGNIPNGSGLSSSASLELLIGVMVNDLFNEGKIDRVHLTNIGQRAENEYVGVNCGIMDQFAVGMGKKNKAILLDCSTLKYQYADADLKDYTLVIMNTNKRRALNESKYNERRAECDEAVELINEIRPLKTLCELTPKEFEGLKSHITKENVRNRAEHAVYENQRVKDAIKVLAEGDIPAFGRLLNESHNSLRDLYEVTGEALDAIVEEALNQESCIGARMTGAGFGGCAIAVVLKTALENFMKATGEGYQERTGLKADFYLSNIGNGTCELK